MNHKTKFHLLSSSLGDKAFLAFGLWGDFDLVAIVGGRLLELAFADVIGANKGQPLGLFLHPPKQIQADQIIVDIGSRNDHRQQQDKGSHRKLRPLMFLPPSILVLAYQRPLFDALAVYRYRDGCDSCPRGINSCQEFWDRAPKDYKKPFFYFWEAYAGDRQRKAPNGWKGNGRDCSCRKLELHFETTDLSVCAKVPCCFQRAMKCLNYISGCSFKTITHHS